MPFNFPIRLTIRTRGVATADETIETISLLSLAIRAHVRIATLGLSAYLPPHLYLAIRAPARMATAVRAVVKVTEALAIRAFIGEFIERQSPRF